MLLHWVLLLLVLQLLGGQVAAFVLRPALKSQSTTTTCRHASSLGDLFSGITGVVPSSLNPPADILAGTSIDPTRDDVDLGRVYKVRIVQFGVTKR